MRDIAKTKVHILIPEKLLREVDQFAGKRERSRFFTEAVAKEVNRRKLKCALEKAAGSWKDTDHPDIVAQGTSRWVRRLREESEARFERMETRG